MEFLRPAVAIDARPVPLGLFEQDLQRGGTRRREEVPALATKQLSTDRGGAVCVRKRTVRYGTSSRNREKDAQTSRCKGVKVSPPPAYFEREKRHQCAVG